MLGGCDTGSAKITRGFRLPARHVIHAVGPVWQGGGCDEDALLASCYRTALELVAEHSLASIAFPAISTGIYAFPADRAARSRWTRWRRSFPDDLRSNAWCSAAFPRNRRGTTSTRRPNSALHSPIAVSGFPHALARLNSPWRRTHKSGSEMARSQKVIITCAVTGSIHTPSMSPHIPITASEIADAARSARRKPAPRSCTCTRATRTAGRTSRPRRSRRSSR